MKYVIEKMYSVDNRKERSEKAIQIGLIRRIYQVLFYQ